MANERLTASLGAVLLVPFAAEGLTIALEVRSTLPLHVFIGMLLVPPVVAKTPTTGCRITQYCRGNPAFVDRGPPMWLLRLAGPFVIVTSIAVLATGIADAVLSHRPHWAGISQQGQLHLVVRLHDHPCWVTSGRRWPSPAPTGGNERSIGGHSRRVAIVTTTLVVGLPLGVWSTSWTPYH